jgi:hypothetical protein
MMTTADLPATMRLDPTRPHVCGLPVCPLRPAEDRVPSGA